MLVLSDTLVFIWKATGCGESLSLAAILIMGTGNCLIKQWHGQTIKGHIWPPTHFRNRCSSTLPNIFISVLTQKIGLSSRCGPCGACKSPCWSPQVFQNKAPRSLRCVPVVWSLAFVSREANVVVWTPLLSAGDILMNSLCLGFRIPLCHRHRSYAEPAVDGVHLKVTMKALVGDTGGWKGWCRMGGDEEVVWRQHGGIKSRPLLF